MLANEENLKFYLNKKFEENVLLIINEFPEKGIFQSTIIQGSIGSTRETSIKLSEELSIMYKIPTYRVKEIIEECTKEIYNFYFK